MKIYFVFRNHPDRSSQKWRCRIAGLCNVFCRWVASHPVSMLAPSHERSETIFFVDKINICVKPGLGAKAKEPSSCIFNGAGSGAIRLKSSSGSGAYHRMQCYCYCLNTIIQQNHSQKWEVLPFYGHLSTFKPALKPWWEVASLRYTKTSTRIITTDARLGFEYSNLCAQSRNEMWRNGK